MNISNYTKRAIIGGIISLLIIMTGTFLLGELSGYEAKVLIKHSLSGLNMLCNTIVLASATILALLLTLLSLSSGSNTKLKRDHYLSVLQIAKTVTGVFIMALMSFLIFNLPITESDNVPNNWFNAIYYASLIVSSILSSALIVVVLMLYNTVVNIIRIVGLGEKDHPLTLKEDDEEILGE
ncbi:hypothetical protein I2486_17615 [Cellulophaga sp. E16_2]|uniref:Transmembrane protein n=1 Tax=Cellulophaga algicola (strain DSM 14237 / IC166 / ACAM 630) TaxID=688270 RepID=E6X8H4_CELAD|nr:MULTISPECIES: hypothetical protein [Cellulophaga]ADV50830.1 hypothetical protein Celal_3569 [Cellulophaga algicola DSM 14237]MBO0593225.1 hypothetical protein [Cellulophaga sp. E16_2]